VWLRARKLLARGRGENAADMCAVFAREAMEQAEAAARTALAACAEGDSLRVALAALRRLSRAEPANLVELRRRIAVRLLDAGRYLV
jgi:hypothetical protein